jgi:hypothetical protein
LFRLELVKAKERGKVIKSKVTVNTLFVVLDILLDVAILSVTPLEYNWQHENMIKIYAKPLI